MLAVAIWAVGGAVAEAVGLGGAPSGARHTARTYVVRPGDTLWSIAGDLSPGTDPRPVVHAIARANGVDAGSLVPGQQLAIPSSG